MITRINYSLLSLIAFVTLAFTLFAGSQLLQPTVAEATEIPTYPFKLTKSISDNYTPDPYTADEFKFDVSDYGIVDLTEYTDDTAEKIIYLPAGTYTVEEVGPAGFVSEDWTLQWSGPGCETEDDGNGPVRPIEITVVETSIDYPGADDVGNACKADNQWRGEPAPVLGCMDPDAENYNPAATEDDDSCTYDNEIPGCTDPLALNYNPLATVDDESCEYDGGNGLTGTIIIEKQTLPDGNQTSFTFNPSWSDTDFALNDGAQSTTTGLATGTHSVVETLPTNWSQTSAVCSDGSPIDAISLQANEKITCVVTNTLDGGGGGENDPKYLVYGYVWHDENESDIWEKEQENPEDDEVDLDAWTVEITNGTVTYSTTTDPTGYYYFYVPAGTWTIKEVLQSGWNQTFPNDSTHTVVVAGAITQAEESNFFAMFMDYLIPTAYAQTPTTYGPFDFGNVSTRDGGGGGNSSGGGGGSSSGSKKKTNDPIPQILGEATSAMPVGAPNTGTGGASPIQLPTLLAILASRAQTRNVKNG